MNGKSLLQMFALGLTGSWIFPASPAAAQSAAVLPDSNAVMGFESPALWVAKGNSAIATTVSATATRTQGSSAYSLASPANQITLTSVPVASTAIALKGVGDVGATFQADIMLPIVAGNPINRGSLQLFLSSPSRRLNNVLIGNVDFTPIRLGLYTTLKFPIPDGVRTALAGASFGDLTFQFMLNSPGTGAGTYLLDNLRVHSAPLVKANAGTKTPPGYGGSVDLVAIGNTPTAQQFDAGAVQVPDGFHLKLGTAGSTTVQLDLGYDGTASFTCTYTGDNNDTTAKSYKLVGCTGGFQPGDLVGASWAKLMIVGGDPSMKIRAQLARNPVGDLVGTGLIPAMPTFWGDFDGCVPAAVANGAYPPVASAPSASCAAQTAEASRIVTAYFDKVKNSQFPPNWIVTPTPETARRHGDGSPHDNLVGVPPPPNDPPFDQEGHVNEGGNWDAYWRMSGNLTDDHANFHNTTSFDMTLSGHAVLFGQDVNVLSIEAAAQSDSGAVNQDGFTDPKASGSLSAFVFGIQLYHKDVTPSLDLPGLHAEVGDDFTVEAQIWIFDVKLSASATAGIDVTGKLTPVGADVVVTPHATIGLHAYGGIGVAGIISGGVDVSIPRLLDANVTAGVLLSWYITTDPAHCNATLNFTALLTSHIQSDGGDISLVATFGDCPFCYDLSHSIFSWGPIFDNPKTIFRHDESGTLFNLPISMCQVPLDVVIDPLATGSVQGNPLTVELTGHASRRPTAATGDASSNVPGIISPDTGYVPAIPCNNLVWSLTGGAFISPATNTGCKVIATFTSPAAGAPALQATINLHVDYDTPNSAFPGGKISESGDAATVTVNVTAPTPGPHITRVDWCTTGGSCVSSVPAPGVPVRIDTSGVNSIRFVGLIVRAAGATGPTTTTWTATNVNGGAPVTLSTSGTIGCDPSICTSTTGTWTNFPANGTFSIAMSATDANGSLGTDTITVNLVQVH